MLVSRFLLDLQEAHQRKVIVLAADGSLHALNLSLSSYAERSSRARGHSTLVFHTEPALGALGATIDLLEWEGLDDSDGEMTGRLSSQSYAVTASAPMMTTTTTAANTREVQSRLPSSSDGQPLVV